MGSVFDNSIKVDSSGSATVDGNLTVNGTTTTIDTVNLTIKDKLIELANGTTGTPSGDAGIIVERGSSTNAGIVWDESEDAWVACTTSATGGSTGDLTLTPGTIAAGSVGIGTTSPSSNLEIEGSSGDLIFEMDNNASNSSNFQIQNGAGNTRTDFVLDGNNHITMKGQRVGILGTNPQYTLDVTGDGKVSTDLTVGGDIILDDGGSLKEAGGTAAITFDGSGHVTKIGQDSPSSGQFLKWDGSKAVWDAVATGSSAADDISTGDAAVTIATTAGNITIDAQGNDTDIIFKGTDGNADTTFLTIDGSAAGAATFNDKIIATELDISGDADIDGTLEADAITVNGTALDEFIQDTVGAMVSSNTETGIAVTYEDGDGTLDFVLAAPTSLGTITQDTVTFTSANSEDPLVQIKNTTNDANGARLQLVKDKGAAASDNDIVGMIEFVGDNDAQEQTILARVQTEVADASDGAEGGRLMLGVATHDAEIQFGLVLEDGDAEDEIDATIGNGDNSVTTAAGYMKANNGFLVPEQKSLHIEAPMLATADHTATGITALMVASENIAQGDLVCVSGNGTIGKADADAVATMPAIGLAVAAISSSNAGVVLLRGMFRDDTYNFTAGNRLFVHTDGTVTATAPSGNGDVAQAVGVALSDDVIYFSPDMTLVEITA